MLCQPGNAEAVSLKTQLSSRPPDPMSDSLKKSCKSLKILEHQPKKDRDRQEFHNRKNRRSNKTGKNPDLFHLNCFCRAGVNTGLAIDTHILVHFCLVILHCNCRRGAFTYAGFASGAFTVVNDSYQLVHSILYIGQKTKKGFDSGTN